MVSFIDNRYFIPINERLHIVGVGQKFDKNYDVSFTANNYSELPDTLPMIGDWKGIVPEYFVDNKKNLWIYLISLLKASHQGYDPDLPIQFIIYKDFVERMDKKYEEYKKRNKQ